MNHKYIDDLIENCNRAKKAEPVKKHSISALGELSDLEINHNSIYIIRLTSGSKEEVFNALSAQKEVSDFKYPKLNSPCNVLYVGSSTTGVKGRLKQHLDKGPKGTYALHMDNWFNGNKYEVEILEYDEPIEVLQIIEDSMAIELKPAFGKTGGNNK